MTRHSSRSSMRNRTGRRVAGKRHAPMGMAPKVKERMRTAQLEVLSVLKGSTVWGPSKNQIAAKRIIEIAEARKVPVGMLAESCLRRSDPHEMGIAIALIKMISHQ